MRYIAFATDYDGTIAHHGRVEPATVAALERVRASGRRLVLVTGRQVDDLLAVFPEVALFDRVVAENGAVVYEPAGRVVHPLGEPPPAEFVTALRKHNVTPLSTGHVIVATWEPHETVVLKVIRELGLELQVIFNKGAVMVLPTGTNKATGLRRALADLGLAPHNTVGVGDAENDQAFLGCVECSVAVANALQSVKDRVDLVTQADHGKGVVELIDCVLSDDLQSLDSRLTRHQLLLGHTLSGEEVRLTSYGRRLLVAGPSGGGKTTVAASLLERLAAAAYQYCIIDPEGDYQKLPEAVSLSGADAPALLEAVLEVLARPEQSVAVSLLDFMLSDRPAFFLALLPRLQELRTSTGRPHWIALDETHHLLPAESEAVSEAVLEELPNLLLITVHPDHVGPAALALVDSLIVVGRNAQMTVEAFSSATESSAWAPTTSLEDPAPGEAWLVTADAPPIRYRVLPPESDRRRHRRKHAEGELGPDKSFYFRGPDGRLNLRAQNLTLFTQLAEGVDDATWLHHLRQQDYSTWIRDAIKDDPLADIVLAVEQRADLSPGESRAQILDAIHAKYTAPR